jgi:hypothetical protein
VGERRNAYRVLVRKTECKRPLGRPGRRRERNIEVNLKWNWRALAGLIWLWTGTNLYKAMKFLDQLRNC